MAFVVSAGRIRAVEQAPNQGFSTPIPHYIQLGATTYTTYEQIWRSQPAVRTVVGFLARNIAQLGLDTFRRVSSDNRVKVTDHPLNRLLERPFPGTKWNKYRLLSWTVHELGIFDEAFWLKGRNDQGARALLPIPRRYIAPKGDNWLAPTQYRITGNKGYRDVDAEQVVHFHGYSPDDTRSGVPPIETLRQILAEEYAASSFREQMWRNGARVAGYIARPADAPKWSDTARTRFKNDWQAQYTGDGPATGGTPVLEDGMRFEAAGVTPKDAQYVEARRLTREEVAVAYFVNPVMLGLMDGATNSNVQSLHRMLYQDTLGPWLTQLSQDIETQLLEDVDAEAGDGRVYVEFNLAEKLRGSFEEQAAALQASVGGPWLTRSEARAMHNLPHLDDADDLIVPLNVIAGGLAGPTDTAPDNPSNAESNGQAPKPKPPKAVNA